MNTSTLFLRNISCVDHAFITNSGFIEGGSFHLSVSVTGPVEENEQVVVDFSNIKKVLKALIDDKENGFDHKLWYIQDYSAASLEKNEKQAHLQSSRFELLVPLNSIRVFPAHFTSVAWSAEKEMSIYLSEEVSKHYGIDLKCEVSLTTNDFSNDGAQFTYWHGLKKSSSWGCKNIAHGHLSFVEVYTDGTFSKKISHEVANYINGAMFLFKENLEVQKDGSWIVQYYTEDRGMFSLVIENPTKEKIIVMEKETTIENITDYIWDSMAVTRGNFGRFSLYLSEGLQKGACKSS